MRGAIYIAGPTASGKSKLALELAERLGGEIISVDSMQVYRGMDIGTAKPSSAERARVPHHLVDVADLDESFDAARFVAMARAAESGILERGKIPIYCGGTGLYFSALIGGLSAAPPDPAVRAELEARPIADLLRELEAGDLETFNRIDRSNPRRVVRAVEILRSGCVPRRWSRGEKGWLFGIEMERGELIERINKRVDRMFHAGMVEETRALASRDLERNRTAMQAIGYRQVVEHLRGERDLAATIELVKLKTRQYAKRQMTWFRHQLQLDWLSPSEAAGLASRLEKAGLQAAKSEAAAAIAQGLY